MHCKLTQYQTNVLRNAFEGIEINQHFEANRKLIEEYYMYPVDGEKYSLKRSKHGDHSINKFTIRKLLSERLIEKIEFDTYQITRKGMEQIMGHKNFTVIKYQS